MRRVLPFVALLALAGCGGGGTAQPAASASFDPKPSLIAACHREVEARLKSPGSAKYSAEIPEQKTENVWTVLGTVDSENGFGALLRTSFLCDAIHDGGEKWRINDVTLTKG